MLFIEKSLERNIFNKCVFSITKRKFFVEIELVQNIEKDWTHSVDANYFITELKSILIKHSFIEQILIDAIKQHILINVYTVFTQCHI
jgi:hypothetical protein